jgi:hexosaminidase
VMSWRGEKGGIEAAREKHNVIMTPGNPVYFDHTQSENEDSVTIGGFNPIEKVYAYEPIPKELSAIEAKYILGAQANMWAEYMKNTKKVEYMLFPRIAALSEILWSPKDKREWKNFEKRLLYQFKRYDLWKVNYSKAYFELSTNVQPNLVGGGLAWHVTSKLSKKITVTTDKGVPVDVFPSPGAVFALINKPVSLKATVVENNKVLTTATQRFYFNKATGKKVSLKKEASKTYPGDGAFTLVNGVINEKGFARTRQFIGFSGEDLEAVIDLGEPVKASSVKVHFLDRKSSWIWRPQTAEAFGSPDGIKWVSLKLTDDIQKEPGLEKASMTMGFTATPYRYIKVIVTNWGDIPAGNPGAGKKAWLFVDEIEVN